jgi:hypothetical protein
MRQRNTPPVNPFLRGSPKKSILAALRREAALPGLTQIAGDGGQRHRGISPGVDGILIGPAATKYPAGR